MLRFISITLLLCGIARGQALLWEDKFNLGGTGGRANSIVVGTERIVVVGFGNSPTESNMLVRAYDRDTGSLAWQDQSPNAASIAAVGHDDCAHIYVAASIFGPSGTDFLVRAYDLGTGQRLWEDIVDKGPDDNIQHITSNDHGVYVVGYGGNPNNQPLDFIVRAYNKDTGNLLWEDQFDGGADDVAWKVVTHGQMVFVAGARNDAPGSPFFAIVRAYGSVTGNLAWDVRRDSGQPTAMALANGQVYIGGPFLESYSATGELTWSKPSDSVLDIAATNSRIYAAGNQLRAYDLAGNILWQTQNPGNEGFNAVGIIGDTILAAGSRAVNDDSNELLVRAFSDNGTMLWENVSHSGSSAIFDIAVDHGQIFVAGSAENDFIVRALDFSPEPQPPAPPPTPPISTGPPGPPNGLPSQASQVARNKIREVKQKRLTQIKRLTKREMMTQFDKDAYSEH